MLDNSFQVLKEGISIASGATTSAAIALPTTSTGSNPLYVRVVAASGSVHIKFGKSDVAATANDLLITTTPQILKVAGLTHFAIIQRAATQTLNITAVEG
ncbi:hypothetical protein [Methylobacter sp. YRD-M1]|uniref:hypothetical protein n=1 Tax=Methylobacter sp. YRD-M1 TaxID=2911520 RepID=UPI00227C2A7F|nr:hypothetical protein [Methylobacter sp. YRD-M1]WAK01866.1 hypothetical protein LZ558_18935 [Methylobacter sp. YRD-M1]